MGRVTGGLSVAGGTVACPTVLVGVTAGGSAMVGAGAEGELISGTGWGVGRRGVEVPVLHATMTKARTIKIAIFICILLIRDEDVQIKALVNLEFL